MSFCIFLCPFISKFFNLQFVYAVPSNYIRFQFCRYQILQLPQAVIMISKCYFPILFLSRAFFICFHNKFLKLQRDFVIILRFVVQIHPAINRKLIMRISLLILIRFQIRPVAFDFQSNGLGSLSIV